MSEPIPDWIFQNALRTHAPNYPHDVLPYNPRRTPSPTKNQWEAIRWNPPQDTANYSLLGTEITVPDPNASSKPDWDTIIATARMLLESHKRRRPWTDRRLTRCSMVGPPRNPPQTSKRSADFNDTQSGEQSQRRRCSVLFDRLFAPAGPESK